MMRCDRDTERFDETGNTRPPNFITTEQSDDDIDRRGFLRCMAWAGTATVWSMVGGIPTSFAASRLATLSLEQRKSMFFVQISDSHIGFDKEANRDVTATLQEAVANINALPQAPAFVLHTGDITQLARAEEFDTADQVLKGLRTDRMFYVPGEHDVAGDNGARLRLPGMACETQGHVSSREEHSTQLRPSRRGMPGSH